MACDTALFSHAVKIVNCSVKRPVEVRLELSCVNQGTLLAETSSRGGASAAATCELSFIDPILRSAAERVALSSSEYRLRYGSFVYLHLLTTVLYDFLVCHLREWLRRVVHLRRLQIHYCSK